MSSFIRNDYRKSVIYKVLTVSEAARFYGYSRRRVLDLCNEGKITARKSGDIWLIEPESLRIYVYLRSTA